MTWRIGSGADENARVIYQQSGAEPSARDLTVFVMANAEQAADLVARHNHLVHRLPLINPTRYRRPIG
jgi:hypothetical protein